MTEDPRAPTRRVAARSGLGGLGRTDAHAGADGRTGDKDRGAKNVDGRVLIAVAGQSCQPGLGCVVAARQGRGTARLGRATALWLWLRPCDHTTIGDDTATYRRQSVSRPFISSAPCLASVPLALPTNSQRAGTTGLSRPHGKVQPPTQPVIQPASTTTTTSTSPGCPI